MPRGGDVPSDAAFRGRCRMESTPDGRVAVKDEVIRVKAAGLLWRERDCPETGGRRDGSAGLGRGPGGEAQESNGGGEGDRLGRVSVAGLAELQQIIQLVEQS